MKQVNWIVYNSGYTHALRDLDHRLYQSEEIIFLMQKIYGYR